LHDSFTNANDIKNILFHALNISIWAVMASVFIDCLAEGVSTIHFWYYLNFIGWSKNLSSQIRVWEAQRDVSDERGNHNLRGDL
jgi:hypothetical protein